MALAHDEWLELNNKQFALYPSIWTLEGMSRQGQFIGLSQRAKQVVKTIYSLGSIIEQLVHWSGTGSKGNCMPEKALIGEVICLFIGNPFDPGNATRKLESGFMLTLQPLITTKLDCKKLDKETTFIQHEDSAGILLNGVNHIYSQINLTREREQLSMKDDNTTLQEGTHDVIDKVMAYEPETLVQNIDDHIFDANDDVDNDMEDNNNENDVIEVGAGVGRPCLMDIVNKGWKILNKMNVKKVRMVAD